MSKESKAKEYAQSVAGSLIENALEAAYLEGFNAGVESVEKPVTTIVEDGVTYVDLGLPSGTMWALNLWNTMWLSYHDALKKNIPNIEQIDELTKNTKMFIENPDRSFPRIRIIGPNGKKIFWEMHGISEHGYTNNVAFWIQDKKDCKENEANYVCIHTNCVTEILSEFTGYHMLTALVKTKE